LSDIIRVIKMKIVWGSSIRGLSASYLFLNYVKPKSALETIKY